MNSKKDKNTNRHVIRRLLRYAKPYWGWFLLSLVLILVTVVFELWQPALIEKATDEYVGHYVDISPGGFSISGLRDMQA